MRFALWLCVCAGTTFFNHLLFSFLTSLLNLSLSIGSFLALMWISDVAHFNNHTPHSHNPDLQIEVGFAESVCLLVVDCYVYIFVFMEGKVMAAVVVA